MKEQYEWPCGLQFTRWFCDRCHMKFDDQLGSGWDHEEIRCAKCGCEICKNCWEWFYNGNDISDGCGGLSEFDGTYLCYDCIENPDQDLQNFLYAWIEYEWLEERKYILEDVMFDWCVKHEHKTQT